MSDKGEVFVNGMTPVTTESEGKVVGFPDVCKAPGPGGPVPIPFPNIAMSRDLENGSRTVRINGAPVALSDSYIGKSTGNEAGTAGGGVVSGKTKGRAHPVNFSFDVRIEGKPVVRNLDPFTLNDHNTAPFPIIQPQGAPPVAVRVDEVEAAQPVELCDYCGKQKHEFDRKGRVGSNLGSSAVLGRNMLEGKELSAHPWYVGPFSLAAHHLICLEALDDPTWAIFCPLFGYHPDRKPNGVFLPMKMALACQLLVAVHRGNHAEGFAFDLHLPYPKAVKKNLQDIAQMLQVGEFCSNPDALIAALDKLSAEILANISSGLWTLTRDGLDYLAGGAGCGGLESISQKPTTAPCPHGRQHGLNHGVAGQPLAPRALVVGE
ncbi:PAAR-like domain-containing protein [Pyxidicoccus sp. 3LG]